MALSPADFYAYSRATGVQIPDDPQERAAMAPEVLDFRRNQLKAPEQNANVLQTIGATALAGAAALGAGFAAHRFLRGRDQIPKGPTRSANAGVVQQDLANLQRAAGRASTAQASVPASMVAQPGAPTPEERQRVYAAVAAKPVEDLPRVYRPKGGTQEDMLMTDPRTGEIFIRGQSPKSFADLDVTDRLLVELEDMRAAQSKELQERMSNAYSKRVDDLLNQTLVEKQKATLEPQTSQRSVFERLRSVNAGMSGAPDEFGGSGIKLYSADLNKDLDLDSPLAHNIFAKAGVTPEEARNYWMQKLSSFNEEDYDTIPTASKNTLVEQQKNIQSLQQLQTAAAVESAEDQISGRTKQRLQQNEDLDMSQIEVLEAIAERSRLEGMEQDEPIRQAVSQLPDGVPVDQTQTAQRLSSQELANIAKSEMMALRQDLQARGLRPGTQRFENALAQTWATKAIPSATPGTTKFRQLQEQGKIDISLPGVIRTAVERTEELPEEEALVSKFLRSVPNVGPEAKVTSTAAGTAIRGASPSLHEVPVKLEERQLYGTGDPLLFGVPEEMGPDIAGSARVAGAMSADIPESELSKQEIAYSFLNKPPTPELAGGAAGIGVYGLEPKYVPGAVSKATGQYSAASEQKPTYTPGWLQRKQMRSGFESLTTPQLMAGAEKATGRVQQAFQSELQRRQTAKESLAVSEMFRRARISGGSMTNKKIENVITSLKEQQKLNKIEESPVLRTQPQNTQQAVNNYESIYNLPMKFAYQNQAIPGTPPTTFEAIQAGLRTSTLRKPGQVPSRVQPGTRITAIGPQGQRQLLEVTNRRIVTPDMAEELSQVERWTPDFLRNYISGYGGGKLEQITYRII